MPASHRTEQVVVERCFKPKRELAGHIAPVADFVGSIFQRHQQTGTQTFERRLMLLTDERKAFERTGLAPFEIGFQQAVRGAEAVDQRLAGAGKFARDRTERKRTIPVSLQHGGDRLENGVIRKCSRASANTFAAPVRG